MLKAEIFESQIILKSLRERKPKDLNMITNIGYGHLILEILKWIILGKIIQ
jgi:hypothetical protein